MMRPPRAPNGLNDVTRWAREVTDFLNSSVEGSSPNTLLSRTTKGTMRSAFGGEGGAGTSRTLAFKGQWEDIDYDEGDIVIQATPAAYEAGITGTYIAKHPIQGGVDPAPGGTAGASAWDVFSPDGTNYQVFTTPELLTQRIVVNQGGDAGTGNRPYIRIIGVTGDATQWMIDLDVGLVQGKRLYPQALVTCGPDGPMQRIFICSDEFEL